MKNKWRHIRDNFMKCQNQGKSGDPAPSKKKKYIYADALAFMLTTVEKRRTTGNIAEYEGEDRRGKDAEDDASEVGPCGQEADSCPQALQSYRNAESPINSRRKTSLTTFQSVLLEKLDRSGDDDPDKMFLVSLLPEYKKLNDDEKLDFRFHCLQFFRNIRCKNSNQTQQHAPANQFYPLYQPPPTSIHYFPGYNQPQASTSTAVNQATSPPFPGSPQDSAHSITSASSMNSQAIYEL